MPSTGKIRRQQEYRRIEQRKTDWFKANGPCKKCGSTNDLQLDHIIANGASSGKQPISKIVWKWGLKRRTEELSKCQVLCHSCHTSKTAIDLRKYEHGINLYERHGCKCTICRAAAALKKREQRARKKAKLLKTSSD